MDERHRLGSKKVASVAVCFTSADQLVLTVAMRQLLIFDTQWLFLLYCYGRVKLGLFAVLSVYLHAMSCIEPPPPASHTSMKRSMQSTALGKGSLDAGCGPMVVSF